jgi:hypothetical protein
VTMTCPFYTCKYSASVPMHVFGESFFISGYGDYLLGGGVPNFYATRNSDCTLDFLNWPNWQTSPLTSRMVTV